MEEGGDIIAGAMTTMDTDAATIAAGTSRVEYGAVALSGGQSRVCVDFGQPFPSSTSGRGARAEGLWC
jgi:hypothetical protein